MAEPWTIEAVAMRFVDAAETSRRLPAVRVQGYPSTWPRFVHEPWQVLVRDGDTDNPRPLPPGPQAVARMLEAMQWVQWLEVEQRHLVWMRAERHGWADIAKRFGCDRTTAWRRWQVALQIVADRLAKGTQGSTAPFSSHVRSVSHQRSHQGS